MENIKKISAKELLSLLQENKDKVIKRGTGRDGGYNKIIGDLLRVCNELENNEYIVWNWDTEEYISYWYSKIEDLELYI